MISDTAELFWKVDSTSWVSSTAEGETWIGSNNLFMPGGAAVPAGDYRVILQNAGGDTVEETFTVASRETSAAAAAYPTASVSEGAIHLGGAYQSADVWTYGKDGRFVATFTASRKGPALDAQKMAAGVAGPGPGFHVPRLREQCERRVRGPFGPLHGGPGVPSTRNLASAIVGPYTAPHGHLHPCA